MNAIHHFTIEELNELRFALANRNSPSKGQAEQILNEWHKKLTLLDRRLHNLRVKAPTINVN